MTNEDRRAKPEDRSAFTPEVRERLVDIINDYLCPVGVTTRIDKKAVQAALDHIDALEARVWRQDDLLAMLDEARSQRDDMARAFVTEGNEYHVACDFKAAALEARVAELEGKLVLLGDACVAQEFSIATGYHAKWQAAEARVAVLAAHNEKLAAECRAWRMYNRAPDTGATVIVKETVAAVDAAGALEGGRS